jgi:hypothetical protein
VTVNEERPVYIASYRVSNQQACFSAKLTLQLVGEDWRQRPPEISYLGIALLRHDLSIITNVILDVPKNFGSRSDFRLFVWRDQLYATTLRKATPLWIETRDHPPFSDQELTQPYPAKQFDENNDNNDTAGVQATILLVNGGKHPLRTTIDYDTFTGSAKNLNYFEDAHGNLQMEFQPPSNSQSKYRPHVVQRVHLDINQCRNLVDSPFNYYNHSVPSKAIPPYQSFYTMDELVLARNHDNYDSPYSTDRGGACCLQIDHPNESGKVFLVGVSHVKPPFEKKAKLEHTHTAPNQYLSRLYAFEPTTPYATVAMSGYFCLTQYDGRHNDNDKTMTVVQGLDTNPLSSRPLQEFFTISNMTLDCPAIHFISGMTQKVNDPNKVILAYGVQDCTTWFVEVNKAELVTMLFHGPASLNSQRRQPVER